jgi:hypothetical protein
MNNDLNNEMNNGLNDTNKVSRKLTIPKNDLLAEGKRILAEQGTGMDHIFKKQVAFNLGTEYKGIVEEKKENNDEEEDEEDEEDEPSKPSPLVRQSSLHPTISEQMIKCAICNTLIIPNILEEKTLCVWCKIKTGVYDTKEKEEEKEEKEEEKTSNHEGLNKLLGMYSKYKELRATVEEILKQPNHPFYDITTVEEVFDCLTFNEVDEMVFTFNENKNVITDS